MNYITNTELRSEFGFRKIAQKIFSDIEELSNTLNSVYSIGRVGICTGSFDVFQSGHAVFFEQCKEYCDILIVVVGRSQNISKIKYRRPINPDGNRLFSVAACEAVDYVVLGDEQYSYDKIDCVQVTEAVNPDVYILNSDDSAIKNKKEFCDRHGMDLQLVHRSVPSCLSPTSSTSIIQHLQNDFPYRLCLTGGWLDQPWISSLRSGSVIVINIHADEKFSLRSGMATSTRNTAKGIWNLIPRVEPEKMARILFGAENPPGSDYISGSQDALGLTLPGINKLHYSGDFWPDQIETILDERTARWLESVIQLVPIGERPLGYDPLLEKNLQESFINTLAESSELAWKAITEKDIQLLGRSVSMTFESWKAILPKTVPSHLNDLAQVYSNAHGISLTGAGGGYFIVITDVKIQNALPIRIKLE